MKTREHICTPNCFRVYRDGKWLKTRVCKNVIAAESVAEHRRLKARRELWAGKPKKPAWIGQKEKR